MMNVHQRVRLAELLSEAAELEHGLMCQYLYAAFSLKREPEEGVTWAQLELMRRWEASIMLVARQEMEHLGLVNNMLTAIGEAPYFVRPNFPLGPRHYQIDIPFKLERLTLDAVGRFIEFEMPRRPDPGSEARMEATVPAVKPGRFQTIGELYEEVVSLFEQLDSPELWIGPPGAQFITTEVIPVPIRGVSLAGKAIYDINLVAVTDLASAKQAIAQILEEGEGIPIPTPTSHFARFLTIAEELATAQHEDPSFDPARPVVENPRGRITSPATREVAELFELAYGTTILMLMRYFAHTDERGAPPLAGPAVNLLGEPMLENRNWNLTLPGFEPIVPFHLQITGGGVTIERDAPLNPQDPDQPVWQTPQELLLAQGARGMEFEPATIGEATGIWDSLKVVTERLRALQRELEHLKAHKGDPTAIVALEGRIAELEFAVANPTDRRVMARYFVERFGFPMTGQASVAVDGNPLGGTLDTTSPWAVSFWLGAWDPDVLCLFMKGALEVPYLTVSD